MVSLKLALSRSASESSMSGGEREGVLKRSLSMDSHTMSSASSSSSSLVMVDNEDITITPNTTTNTITPLANEVDHKTGVDDLKLLALSTQMTELSYNISDIHTRIFEIQELRHQSQASESKSSSSTSVIDQALMSLDERLEAASIGMKAMNEAIEPLLARSPQHATPEYEEMEYVVPLRKHAALVAEWESVQDETDVLREELKEDKWLTVFRTVSEQADGMMTSLEKAIKRCQDFIWRVHKRAPSEDNSTPWSPSDAGKLPLNYESFCTLLESFEAKKKHYMPATTKVLSIIDKGVQDRVTKNGECLRRHAESTQRWRNLRERIVRTDSEMENIRKIMLARENESSEVGSATSGDTTRSGKVKRLNSQLATPSSSESSKGRPGVSAITLGQSMSPFRKLARKLSKATGRATPTQPVPNGKGKTPTTEPSQVIRQRSSLFPLRQTMSETPDRSRHKHSMSFTPESPTVRKTDEPPLSTLQARPRWNSSTKPDDDGVRTVKQAPTIRKRSSAANFSLSMSNGDIPPVPPLPGRSMSQSSFAPSRPWSPLTNSAASTGYSSASRPQSRAQSPMFYSTRVRPTTPSHIPTPVFFLSAAESEASYDGSSQGSSLMQRAISPTLSTSGASAASYTTRAKTPLGTHVPLPRPPSRSMIPIPKFSPHSRSTSSMSSYDRPESSMSFRSSMARAQTPESALRNRVSQLPFYQTPAGNSNIITPPASRRASRLPPSSFRESSATPSLPRLSLSGSRPASRAGTYTPSQDPREGHKYVPNPRDPLDVEVAAVVNSMPHGLLVERVDPPLPARAPNPKDGEEVKAQYAFSNQLARKVVTCRLLTMTRTGQAKSRKVMCRVGGGWQDLQLYILNRQAGM